MIRLTHWNAKRAGAGITVQGVNFLTGQVVKVVGVVEISVRPTPPRVVARTAKDEEYLLSLGSN